MSITQLQKNFLEEDRLKLTASLRYDKAEWFDAFFSPRLSLGYSFGQNKDHNVRASVQTGFRNPDTQALYIGFNVGPIILLGSAPNNPERDVRTVSTTDPVNTLSATGAAIIGANSLTYNGRIAYDNSFTRSSVNDFIASTNPLDLAAGNPTNVKPEQVTSYEIGYRGKFDKLIIDMSAYYNQYQDFITTIDVVSPLYGNINLSDALPDGTPLAVAALAQGDFQAYRAYTNTDKNVNSYGAAIQVSTKVLNGFDLSANYTYAKLDFDRIANPDFQTNFNTPQHKVKVSFGKTELFKNFGFNASWRWSDYYLWEASFVTAEVPAFHVMDAQINLRVPSLKSTFKAGATNLLGDEYFTAVGTGFIGSQYYLSWTINNL